MKLWCVWNRVVKGSAKCKSREYNVPKADADVVQLLWWCAKMLMVQWFMPYVQEVNDVTGHFFDLDNNKKQRYDI